MPGKPNSPLGQAPWVSASLPITSHYIPFHPITVLHRSTSFSIHYSIKSSSSLHQVKDRDINVPQVAETASGCPGHGKTKSVFQDKNGHPDTSLPFLALKSTRNMLSLILYEKV